MEVTPHDNPAHNGEAQNRQSAKSNDVVRDDFIVDSFATAGNAVGSPLLGNEYDPVTTEPKGEASVAVIAQRLRWRCGKSRTDAIRGLLALLGPSGIERALMPPRWLQKQDEGIVCAAGNSGGT